MCTAGPWARLYLAWLSLPSLGAWLSLAVDAGKYPGGRHGPEVLWKGPQTFRKSLNKNCCVLASALHYFFLYR
jgi:hypothetical protein